MSEVAEAGKSDPSRTPIPTAWAELALARLGDPKQVEWAQRLSGGIDGNSDAAVSAAANKLRGHHFSPDWPWGSEALSETVLDDNTKLGQWRDCCVPHKEIAGPVAHIDTTLLCNAIGVLNGKLPATPITVLDLASLINTICVYDKICYLESRNVERSDVEQLLGKDVFVELPVASTAFEGSDYEMLNDISQPLRNLYKHRTVPWINDVRTAIAGTKRQRKAWVKSWETILGRPCKANWLLRCPDEGGLGGEYHDVWSTDTPTLLRDIIDVDEYALANADRDAMKGRRATPAKQRSVLAQTSTARALFNTHIAEILGIRYAASLARIPALRVIAEDSRHIVAQLTQVAPAEQALQDVFGEAAIAATRKKPDFLEIPFFAAEVFQRADVPMQIPEILDDVRAKSRAFRERLLEINVAIDAGDRAGVDRLRASLRTEATLSVWRRLGFPATTATTTSLDVYLTLTDPTATALAIIVAVMGAVLNWDSIRPLLGRSRPVCGLVEDISPIVKSTEAITKLWNIDDTALWIPRMRSLTSLSQRTFGEAIR